MDNELKHYGILGMRWGTRKRDNFDYQTKGFTIKKGTEIHRVSSTGNEINKGSGYASFLKKDSKSYSDTSRIFSKFGMTQFDLTLKAKKDMVSPSQKKRIDVFIKKLSDPKFNAEFKAMRRRMFILNMVYPNDIKLALKSEKLSLNKARQYRMLNQAISANKSLRKQYLDEFKKLGYDFILDEADATSGVSKAPIIFIEREHSLEFIKADKLG